MSNTKIMNCVCDHEFQDKRYGKKKRVHNETGKDGAGSGVWRCTVCGRVGRA